MASSDIEVTVFQVPGSDRINFLFSFTVFQIVSCVENGVDHIEDEGETFLGIEGGDVIRLDFIGRNRQTHSCVVCDICGNLG